MTDSSKLEKIQEFIAELSGFAETAEKTLTEIEKDAEHNKGLFSVFSERMYAIRGTAQQLELPKIAELAGLGEEIAIKGATAEKNSQVRKCVGSLWDTLTTVKYMLLHPASESTEEQQILLNRLQVTLKSFGGARETVNVDEIEALLNARK